ncbi:hypothetical protein C2869_06180 [Saccharobesus litoralis]|uniref:DUF2787 domain-containing protein n=1 Tax=Saccharobesus litoralis TaxID=2172099 RepID=A0A2S0VPA4_9ALTE|nr:DUF2787 family protein [Saccharobesus litoralis]AWB66051.1 hypothetical protein C2869_06180 [Saccharobesus litoralis]
MRILYDGLALPVSEALGERLKKCLENTMEKMTDADILSLSSVILNFRDPDYDAISGGYHPVEIRFEQVNQGWCFSYITDFSYQGQPPFAELAKELDFDFQAGITQIIHCGVMAIENTRDIYCIWEKNFLHYASCDIYQVFISFE